MNLDRANKLDIFIASLGLLASIYFFFGLTSILSGYFSWNQIKNIYSASLIKQPVDYSFLKPFRNWKVDNLELEAKSAISVAVTKNNKQFPLFVKNSNQRRPIASLTKLMVAYVALEHYKLDRQIKIQPTTILPEGDVGEFQVGDTFFFKDLLHSMLMESSNEAALAIAQSMGEKNFVYLMNVEAQKLGMQNTFFAGPIGFDPDYPGEPYNYSTARDLSTLINYLIQQSKTDTKIDFLWKILRTKEYTLRRTDGTFHHEVMTTDKVIDQFPNLLGAKTGSTPMAGKCFILVLKQNNNRYLINIILDSNHRFSEMEKMVAWVNKAYIW